MISENFYSTKNKNDLLVLLREQSKLSQEKDRQILVLEEKVRLLQANLFGKKSERFIEENPDQTHFLASSVKEEDIQEEAIGDFQEIKPHKRKKGGRKAFPKDLVRREIIHDLSESEKVCSCGCNLSPIGEESSEKLEIIPAKLEVVVHKRLKYTCLECTEEKREIKKT